MFIGGYIEDFIVSKLGISGSVLFFMEVIVYEGGGYCVMGEI